MYHLQIYLRRTYYAILIKFSKISKGKPFLLFYWSKPLLLHLIFFQEGHICVAKQNMPEWFGWALRHERCSPFKTRPPKHFLWPIFTNYQHHSHPTYKFPPHPALQSSLRKYSCANRHFPRFIYAINAYLSTFATMIDEFTFNERSSHKLNSRNFCSPHGYTAKGHIWKWPHFWRVQKKSFYFFNAYKCCINTPMTIWC